MVTTGPNKFPSVFLKQFNNLPHFVSFHVKGINLFTIYQK